MKKSILICFIFFYNITAQSQELFPHVDPASLVPKGVLGVRIYNQAFTEVNQFRSLQNIRFMLGLNSKVMITQWFSFSNAHGRNFPQDFIKNDFSIGRYTNGITKGKKYPYIFGSLGVSVKYRFLSIDGEKKHFRMAAYFDLSGCNAAHGYSEPSLVGDNGGVGGGITATKLHKRFAISGSIGGVLPHNYYYSENDSSLEIFYAKGLTYSISTGYLCLPLKYKNYNQTNVNVYAEFIGKAYQGSKILSDDKQITILNAPQFVKGNYIEFRPSVQFIFNSNLRLDLSVGTPLVGRSYVVSYPTYYFTIQRYFYFK